MKATAKGNQFEIEVKKILERQGNMVFRQHRRPMFINGRMITVGSDIFGCDMVCKRLGSKPRWIQVSTVENKSKKERQVREFPWNLDYEDLELWLRVTGKKAYRVFRLVQGPDPLDTKGPIFVEVETETVKEAA